MMLNSDEIRRSILQGQMPDTWRVVRGSALSGIIYALFIFCLFCVALSLATTIVLFGFSALLPTAIEQWTTIWIDLLKYLGFTLFLSMTIAYVQARRAKDAIMVFLPEGCLELLNVSSTRPVPTQHAIRYAQTSSLRLHVNIVGNVILNVQTHDNMHYQWVLNPYYGNRVDLAQDILIAYTTYAMLHRGTLNERTSE
jgi:hypothetical protein